MHTNNIAATLLDALRSHGSRTAVISSRNGRTRQWTFTEVEQAIYRFSVALQRAGVQQGDRVVLMVRPSMEFVALSCALFTLGAPVILIDPGMGYKNLLQCIGNVRPDVLIGIPQAHLFRRCFPRPFRSLRTTLCVGQSFGFLGPQLKKYLPKQPVPSLQPVSVDADELAAIIFTTGSTGPPKGVQYSHGIFRAQLRMIHEYYDIQPGDVDQPAFPLFALFALGLGATAVIPDMDPTRPAQVNPKKFTQTILAHKVTYSFGSPAIWQVVSRYCQKTGTRLPTMQKVLMAGAPVPGDLVQRVLDSIGPTGEVFTPYGATECLPIVSMGGEEIVEKTWEKTAQGHGTCVGRALPGIRIGIIEPVDGAVSNIDGVSFLPSGAIGEIIVQGPVVTRAYDHNERENALAKIRDGVNFWHRIGDMGYVDEEGRLWFCGRKAHRVLTKDGSLYSVCCEAVFNNHPDVMRSALVGIGGAKKQLPVIVVELLKGRKKRRQLFAELAAIGVQYTHTKHIHHFLVHPSFPVDIRHNAKIFREKLAVWAAQHIDRTGA